MAVEYEVSERIEQVAKELIGLYHPHLAGAKIAYMMKKAPEEKDGKVAPQKQRRMGKKGVMGVARTVPALYYALTGFDFVIEIDEIFWDILDLDQQTALVDHELCHCVMDEKGFYVRDYDVEEFVAIVKRHGNWKHELEAMFEAMQMRLPFETPGKQESHQVQ